MGRDFIEVSNVSREAGTLENLLWRYISEIPLVQRKGFSKLIWISRFLAHSIAFYYIHIMELNRTYDKTSKNLLVRCLSHKINPNKFQSEKSHKKYLSLFHHLLRPNSFFRIHLQCPSMIPTRRFNESLSKEGNFLVLSTIYFSLVQQTAFDIFDRVFWSFVLLKNHREGKEEKVQKLQYKQEC